MGNISHTKIVSYQHDWSKKFIAEAKNLRKIFGDSILELEHIGSTSIKGLASKPIIDIVVIVKNQKDADYFTKPLSKIGYKLHSMSTERHFYVKGDPIKYHLSIAYADKGGFWKRQIFFRDYLCKHKEVAKEYASLKLKLLKKDPTGINEYFKGKSKFVYKILKLAGWKDGQKYR